MRPIVLMGHERPLTQVKYNKEGDLLFSCSKDASASIWYSANGERLGTLNGHAGTIWSIDVDIFTRYCVTGSADYTVKLWNVCDGVCINTWNFPVPVKRVEFSPCGEYILVVLDDVMKYPGSINVYHLQRDPETHEIIKFEEDPLFMIQTLGEEYDLDAVCVAGWSQNSDYIIAAHKNGSLSKYEINVKNNKDGNEPYYKFITSIGLHTKAISDLQFSLDRTYFITSSRDSTSQLLDVDDLQVLKSYVTECPLNTACITPLKEFVILGGGQDAQEVTTTSSSEGNFEARIYHKIFEEEIGRVKGHFGPLNCVAVSPQGTSYTSGGEDGLVRLHHFEKSYFDFKYDVEKAAEAKEHMQEQLS